MLSRILSDPQAIFLVILFFGASIFVHEWGHYIAARWRKLKIERFSIGFGPRLFGWKDKQGVDWRISLFPLGGYVALPQLADMRGIEGDYDNGGEPLPRISYADKMYVAGAGAFFNVLFALFLGCILWATGLPVSGEYQSTTVGYIAPTMLDEEGMERDGPALRAGLQPGDVILKIDDASVSD
ncbi:MAG: site-2 protease family protein, partial [Puniceicoccaceae bacterium]